MRIALQPDGHAESVTNLMRATDGIQGELDALDAQVAVLRDRWSGEAQLAYDQAHREWSAAMTRMREVLRDATSAAQTAGTGLAEADSNAAALWL